MRRSIALAVSLVALPACSDEGASDGGAPGHASSSGADGTSGVGAGGPGSIGGDAGGATSASGGAGQGAAGTGGAPLASSTVDASAFASIQDAIDSLEGIGGAVYLAAGTHFVTEKIRIHSGVTLFGAGMDRTVVAFAPGSDPDHMIGNDSSSGQANVTVRDLSLLGPGPDGGPGCCNGIKLENLVGGLVVGVSVEGFGRDGIYLGYKLKGGEPKGVSDVRVSGCRLAGNGRNGVSLVHGGSGVVIDDNLVQDDNQAELVAAIDLEPDDGTSVEGARIVGNTVVDNPNNGIQLYSAGGSYGLSGNAVCFNVVEDNEGTGIADNGDGDTFVGNQLAGNGADQSLDGSAHEGAGFEADCGTPLPPLPAAPPLP